MHDTKERLLRAGEKLFRSQGYSGTGLKQLAKEAGAPWSSMYHFFPLGKEQLAAEAHARGGGVARLVGDESAVRRVARAVADNEHVDDGCGDQRRHLPQLALHQVPGNPVRVSVAALPSHTARQCC